MSSGPLLFARFAYPPNLLCLCGPEPRLAAEYLGDGGSEADLRHWARSFEGAYPYLELIAHQNGLADPLSRAVVEAYWIGNSLLERIELAALGDSLRERFRTRLHHDWLPFSEGVMPGALPHHSFHVLFVYPWLGLLRTGRQDPSLRVIDRCRIRWGRVVSSEEGVAMVDTRPLVWRSGRLVLGPSGVEVVQVHPGTHLVPGVNVALHWDWVCDPLTDDQLAALVRHTRRQLLLANRQLEAHLVEVSP